MMFKRKLPLSYNLKLIYEQKRSRHREEFMFIMKTTMVKNIALLVPGLRSSPSFSHFEIFRFL